VLVTNLDSPTAIALDPYPNTGPVSGFLPKGSTRTAGRLGWVFIALKKGGVVKVDLFTLLLGATARTTEGKSFFSSYGTPMGVSGLGANPGVIPMAPLVPATSPVNTAPTATAKNTVNATAVGPSIADSQNISLATPSGNGSAGTTAGTVAGTTAGKFPPQYMNASTWMTQILTGRTSAALGGLDVMPEFNNLLYKCSFPNLRRWTEQRIFIADTAAESLSSLSESGSPVSSTTVGTGFGDQSVLWPTSIAANWYNASCNATTGVMSLQLFVAEFLGRIWRYDLQLDMSSSSTVQGSLTPSNWLWQKPTLIVDLSSFTGSGNLRSLHSTLTATKTRSTSSAASSQNTYLFSFEAFG